jgi:hypothetical protein
MTGDRLAASGVRVPVNRMGTALTFKGATVGFKVADQLLAFLMQGRGESVSPHYLS